MGKRAKLLACLVGAMFLGTGLVVLRRDAEPRYQGRRLSDWVFQTAFLGNLPGPSEEEAVQAIGTNAIPYLLRWIQTEPPRWQSEIEAFLHRRDLGGVANTIFPREKSAFVTQLKGYVGFIILGPKAAAAIPELKRLAVMSPTRNTTTAAREVLPLLGLPALPTLLEFSASTDDDLRACGVSGLGEMSHLGTNGSAAFSVLLRSTHDSYWYVVMGAVYGLGKWQRDPALTIPTLEKCLHHEHSPVRQSAIQALMQFGQEAQPAIPTIARLLSDSDDLVRKAATNALLKIGPEVLRNATAQ